MSDGSTRDDDTAPPGSGDGHAPHDPPSAEDASTEEGLAPVFPFLAPGTELEIPPGFPMPGEEGTTLIEPDDPDAPPLLITTEEPPPRPSQGAEVLESPETLATLRKLAGPRPPSREDTQEALRAALQGLPYNASHLPDARAIALGVARAALEAGLELEHVVEKILAAVDG